MADLKQVTSQKDADESGIVVPITQRDGKPYLAADGSPSTITVYGSESKTYLNRRDAFYRELAKEEGEGDPAFNRVCIAACAVKDWHGWESEGKPLPCSQDNARALLTVEHIMLQVERGASKGADFFGVASTG